MPKIMEAKADLLAVVRAALHGTAAPDANTFSDFSAVCRLARRNCVQSMVYLALKSQKDALPAEDFARLGKSFQAAVLRETAQQSFLCALREKFDAAGIDFMLLKGTHVKALYPAAEMRFMVDMDVLVREADVERAQEILLGCGLSLHLDNGKDIIYMRKPFLTVELHRALFQKEDDLYPHFLDVWERAVPLGAHEYKMSDEELYIYTLAHLAEHYTTAGSCFRPVMDLYLLEQKTALDFSALDARFREMGLDAFAEKVRALYHAMFDGAPKGETLLLMENYILLGPPVQHADAAAAAARTHKSKPRRLLAAAFPRLSHMRLKYPVLKKAPFLLPVFWVVRLLQYAFTKDKSIARKREALMNADEKSAAVMEKIFKASGL